MTGKQQYTTIIFRDDNIVTENNSPSAAFNKEK